MRLQRMAHAVMDLVFPGRCAGCDADCDGRSPLCAACQSKFTALLNRPACEWCASPLAYENAPCPYCLGKGFPLFDRIACIGTFDDPIRHMVHAIKYHGAWPLAEHLAEQLFRQPHAKTVLEAADLLIPVPLHPFRLMSRGYNQAQLIAGHLAKKARLKVAESLVRLRHTETQTQIHSKAKREENVEGAFGLTRPRRVRGKHVVLVDDVMTTGATLRAAARELRKGSPAGICALVLSIADSHGFARV